MSKDKYAAQKNASQQSQPSKAANPPAMKQQITQPPKAANPPEMKQQVMQTQAGKTTVSPSVPQDQTLRVQPEQMSLTAHKHIQTYLQTATKTDMEKEDLNAVLRLSQHLRLFGLLSAVGYVNQSNAQGGKVRDRTVPVWSSLLGQMLAKPTDATNPNQRRELMETVVEMARNQPSQYMASWRKSMMLSEQWNFWARAYAKGE